MRKWLFSILGLILLVVFIIPIVVEQIGPSQERNLVGVSLGTLEYTPVSFRNEEQDLNLAGLLFKPEGEGPFPGVVIIHGSGTSSRENPWYLTLSGYLQEHGVVVLLPDKRGSVGSSGDWQTSSFEDLATDTIAALEYLREQAFVETSRIGIVGMSQGGQIAPIVAAKSDHVDFVVNVVGSSLPLYDVLQYEETNNLREVGLLPGVSDLIAYPSTFVLREFSQKAFWEVVGDFDPVPYWQEVKIPALALYGSEDTNVPSEASKQRLEALEKQNIEVLIFEGSGHALEDPPGRGNSFFREDALSEIEAFIKGPMWSEG